jgi:hypothetical protein
MSVYPKSDIGASLVGVQAATIGATQVAGGAGDATKVTGTTINRKGAMSCTLVITGTATLQATKTQSFAVEYQTSTDGSTWATAVAMQASTVAATGDTGGSTETYAVELDLLLKGKPKYIRFNVTPDLDAADTDTAVWSAACVLGGYDTIPASQASS